MGLAAALTGCGRSQGILEATPPLANSRVSYGTDPNQFGDLWLPPGPAPHPVIVFLHGGFWLKAYNLAHASFACQALSREGFAVWSLEYRRLGQAGGGWPGTFDDVRRGAEHLRQLASHYALDLKRVIASGHSAEASWRSGSQSRETLI